MGIGFFSFILANTPPRVCAAHCAALAVSSLVRDWRICGHTYSGHFDPPSRACVCRATSLGGISTSFNVINMSGSASVVSLSPSSSISDAVGVCYNNSFGV